jgi:hypothetical protein
MGGLLNHVDKSFEEIKGENFGLGFFTKVHPI